MTPRRDPHPAGSPAAAGELGCLISTAMWRSHLERSLGWPGSLRGLSRAGTLAVWAGAPQPGGCRLVAGVLLVGVGRLLVGGVLGAWCGGEIDVADDLVGLSLLAVVVLPAAVLRVGRRRPDSLCAPIRRARWRSLLAVLVAVGVRRTVRQRRTKKESSRKADAEHKPDALHPVPGSLDGWRRRRAGQGRRFGVGFGEA